MDWSRSGSSEQCGVNSNETSGNSASRKQWSGYNADSEMRENVGMQRGRGREVDVLGIRGGWSLLENAKQSGKR